MQNQPSSQPAAEEADEPPPFLGSWKRVYIAVLGYLGALIAVLYVLTQYFRH